MQNYYEKAQQIKRKLNWTYLLLVPYLVIGLVPWLKYRLPFRFLLPLPMLWLVLNLRSIKTKLLPNVSVNFFYKWTLFLGIVFLLKFLYGLIHGQLIIPTTADMVDLFFNFLVFCILHVSVNNGHIKELKFVVLVCLASLVLAAVVSIRGFDEIEGGARILTAASSEDVNMNDIVFAMQKGIGSYGTIYSLGLLLAPLILLLRSVSLLLKLAILVMMVLFFIASLRAAFSILMFAISFGIIVVILRILKIRGILFHTFVGIALFVIILSTSTPTAFRFIDPALDSLSMLTEDHNYQFRIQSMKEAINGNTDPANYASYRPALYWNSIDVFLTAPLTGYKGFSEPEDFRNILGGHSFVFDALGGYGLLGASIYLAFYVFYFKYIRRLIIETGYTRFAGVLLAFFYPFLLVGFLNPLWGYQIFVDFLLILPGLFFFAEPRFPRRPSWMGQQASTAVKLPVVTSR